MNENNIFNSNEVAEGNLNDQNLGQPVYQVVSKSRKPILPIILLVLSLVLIGLGIYRLVNNQDETAEPAPEIVDLDLSPVANQATAAAQPNTIDITEQILALAPRSNVVENTPLVATPVPNPQPVQVVETKQEVKKVVKHLDRVPRLDTCGNRDGDKWHTKFIFPKVENADDYWVIIGTREGSNDVLEQRLPGRHEQTLFIDLENDKDYYVKYSVRINGEYSEFSPILQVRCEEGNRHRDQDRRHDKRDRHDHRDDDKNYDGYYGNFKGFRCIKDEHICESTNEDNPPYANSKAGLEKCAEACK